ncbi:MAG: T9SS type A sorting domain-containing protein [Bacteroidia bacterium]
MYESTECSIVDANGRIVRTFTLPASGNNYNLSIAELSPGYYVLHTANGMNYKLIKI